MKENLWGKLARSTWWKNPLLINCLKYGLGPCLLAYMVWSKWAPSGGQPGLNLFWQERVIESKPINVGPLVLAVGILAAAVMVTFMRWWVLVRAQGFPFTLANATRLGLVGYFLNNLFPGSIGGDLIKAAFIAREHDRRTVAVSTVIIDRVIGLWGLFWLVALVGASCWAAGFMAGDGEVETRMKTIVLTDVGIVIASVMGWLLLGVLPERRATRFAGRLERIPKVGHSAAEFWRAVWMYRCRGVQVALALGLAVVGHVGFVFTFYFSALTLFPTDQIPSLLQHFLIVPIGMTVQACIPVPGGLGVGEAAYSTLYALVNPNFGRNGFLAALMQRVITWGLSLCGYFVYLRMRPAIKAQEAEAKEEEVSEEAFAVAEKEREFQGRPQLVPEP